MTPPFDSLSAPLTLARGPSWRNRLALSALTNRQSNADGTLHDAELSWLRSRARDGFGMVLTSAAHVNRSGQSFAGQLGAGSDGHVAGLGRIPAALRAEGSVAILQLHHGGLRADATVSGVPSVAPWDDAETGSRALTTREVDDSVRDFVSAAVRAEAAGFEGVEVHGAHGYLIGQFLDHRNDRSDGYGGPLASRARFLYEILEGVRTATGPAFQVGVRLTAQRYDHGILISESLEVATRLLESDWVDFLDWSLWDAFSTPEGDQCSQRPLVEHVLELPSHGVRIGVGGRVLSAAQAVQALDLGADFVLIGRGAIRHHDFATRALTEPSFASSAEPVTRDHLRSQGIGEPFVDYLNQDFEGFVR
ncbi:NADH:flavin oxidoreductase/NADH oxidase [metagenome]|uniref:NADH:flavin oxidoreductase/NADH oxidase n=1 Tax=metagenome TaxID=256318 RepID=A0A2P2CBP3_9ZZZZ